MSSYDRIKPPRAYVDTANVPSGALEMFWKKQGARDALSIRKAYKLPQSFIFYDQEHCSARFGLSGWQYGKWANQEDRFNYVANVSVGFFHLCKVLGIEDEKRIGQGKLSIGIGVRGVPKSKATFWPSLNQININRWKRFANGLAVSRDDDEEYKTAIGSTGGVGSLAHEFAHFVDRLLAEKAKRNRAMFSQLVETTQDGKHVARIFDALFFDEGKNTPFQAAMASSKTPGYWRKREEIFARAFEKCVGIRLRELKIPDYFLAKKDYSHPVYPSEKSCRKAWPYFLKLFKGVL